MPSRKRRLEYNKRALREYRAALAYIAEDSPANADLVQERIERTLNLILSQPSTGTPGKVTGTRDWPAARTGLTITYRIKPTVVQVLRIRSQRRKYP